MVRSFGIARIAVIVGVSIGVALIIAVMASRAASGPMTLLYADLDPAESKDLIARLDRENVKYDVRDENGRLTVYAPQEKASELKLKLAGDGFIAKSAGVGYEIFDQQEALGTTTFQQNINRLRALEGELSRTISTISGVRSARVHLALPERQLFTRDRQEPKASIVVDAPSGLDKRSVRAIVNLTASAVPGLKPGRVTLLDAAGDLLASGEDGADALAAGIDEKVAATEARIRRTVEDIVGRIVGPKNMRVQVAADLDMSRVTETANIIDPDSQTVLSNISVNDATNTSDPAGARGVTVANQLPNAAAVDPQEGDKSTTASRRTEETTNYEMTRTVRNEVREMGGIKRLSVAVALNTPTTIDVNGAAIPAPRNEQALARITSLVRTAVGYNAARGDQVDVVETPFNVPVAEPVAAGAPATIAAPRLTSSQIMRGAEFAALGLVALALIMFVLRPMLTPPATTPALTQNALPHEVGAEPVSPSLPAQGALETLVTLGDVEGKVQASSLKRVADVVKSHSDESASILKSWIRQAS